MTSTMNSQNVLGRWLRPLALASALGMTGCDSVLEVNDPDIITTATSTAAALALRNGAVLRLAQAMSGGGDNPDGMFPFSGLLADEWQSGDSFEQRNSTDQRVIATTNSFVANLFRRVHRVRIEGASAIASLRQYAPTPTSNIGLMFALAGFAENQLGENFCNGIPFSEIANGVIIFGVGITNDSTFSRAIAHADSARAWVGGTDGPRITSLAAIVKGRALLNRNKPAEAAAAVAGVATSFAYQITHSVNTTDNATWLQNISLKRYTVGNSEGTNGLNYRSANDPRIPSGPTNGGVSFDGVAPYLSQGIWVNRTDPVNIATGIEARLIEAEAALRAGDTPLFLAKLNEARATKTGLAPLTDPGTADERVNLLFRERAFWMFGTGHRHGDLRRMVRQYSRSANSVFPTGNWFKGGPYGSDINFPIPFEETNNPNFTTCTDRNA